MNKNVAGFFSLALLLLLGWGTGCDSESTGSALQDDITDPVVRVEGINQGDTLVTKFDAAGNSLNIDLLDETGLSGYSITVSLNGQTVFEQADSSNITQAFETLDLSGLETNTVYNAEVFVEDAAGNNSTLTFYLLITFEEAVTEYENLYMLGTATEGGYDLAQQSPMTRDPDNPNIFTWTDTLTAGEFKIKTYPEEDFCMGEWIHPPTEEGALSDQSYQILEACAGNTDYKWNVTEAGIYTITLNFSEETIDINQDLLLGETFDEIFMIGSATPGGWDLNSQTELTQDPGNSDVFSWSGALTAGEFKFKLYAGQDFCAGKWIHPKSSGQPLSETGFDILVGCAGDNPDYKWEVSESQSGNYSITINLNTSTIQISEQ